MNDRSRLFDARRLLSRAAPAERLISLESPSVIAVLFTRGESWDASRILAEQEGIDGHIAFVRRTRDEGVIVDGGPFHDPAGLVADELVGLALLNVDSLETARDLIATDPVVKTGAFGYRLYAWDVPPLRRR